MGVITKTGSTFDAIVMTSHPGVLDSELQNNDVRSPTPHTHYVDIVENSECNSNNNLNLPLHLAVGDLSFESPGKLIVKDNIALLKNLPPDAVGQFSEEDIIPGSDVDAVASFILVPLLDLTQLQPSGSGDPLVAVCIEDIKFVDERYWDIFYIKNHYGFGSDDYYPSYYDNKHDNRGEYQEKDYRNNYDYDNEHRR